MLYTRKGDTGTTKTINSQERFSKSSAITEALGALDEINSLLGLCKTAAASSGFLWQDAALATIIDRVQHNLFIVQAELAGADKTIDYNKVLEVEGIIDQIEKFLPPIKSFFVSGGTELAARLDHARAVSRRTERRVIAATEAGQAKVAAPTLAYLNRLSSLLYALARLVNHQSGIKEEAPSYL